MLLLEVPPELVGSTPFEFTTVSTHFDLMGLTVVSPNAL